MDINVHFLLVGFAVMAVSIGKLSLALHRTMKERNALRHERDDLTAERLNLYAELSGVHRINTNLRIRIQSVMEMHEKALKFLRVAGIKLTLRVEAADSNKTAQVGGLEV